MRRISPTIARRLALVKQRLAGPRPAADPPGLLQLVRDLGCLQLDPIRVVEKSHRLVLFSRLGAHDPAALDQLLWKDRSLFEYWAHCASIVLTEHYPIHANMMRRYGEKTGSAWVQQLRVWVEENEPLRRHILEEIEKHGPLPSRHFEDSASRDWTSEGWNSGRNVGRMLDWLWLRGQLMVAGRSPGAEHKLWDLTERCLPEQAGSRPLPDARRVQTAAQISLRALGVARRQQIGQHFIRGRYPELPAALAALQAKGRIEQVEVGGEDGVLPGPWYVHAEDLPLLDALEAGDWQPRTTLLSPFDNLICDRARTEQLFGFDFRMEIYVPKAQRKHGYYVLPVLHEDRLVGRIDPVMDRKRARLTLNAVHAEPGAPKTKAAVQAIGAAIQELAGFLGAREVEFAGPVPGGWKRWLD